MAIETDILKALIAQDHFRNKDGIVDGIARRAIDKGYDSLSEKQQDVLRPFLNMDCPGVTDPGENHNNCQRKLDGADLLSAIDISYYYGEILCERCRDESDGYAAHWARIQAE